MLIVMDEAFEMSAISAALKLHGVNVVGEAGKGTRAIALQRTLQPNVLLIDMHFSDEHSVAIAKDIRKENPEIGVVMLVPCADLRLLGEIHTEIPAGTKVVLKKSINNIAALCDVISQSRLQVLNSPVVWINGSLALSGKALESLMSKLTNIQIQTLRLVADGLTNAEISRIRFVSEKSVEQIVSRISQVLNVQPDPNKNMRVQLVGEYFKWIGAPRH